MRFSALVRVKFMVGMLLLGSTLGATAADLPLNGRRIVLKDDSTAARRQTFVKLVDRRVDLTGIDPTVTGATAEIGRLSGGSPLVVDLPAIGWRAGGAGPADFRYRSKTGPLRSARLSQGKFIRLWARGPGAYALDGMPQGNVSVVLAVGDVRFCGAFGGTIRRDDGARFYARAAPAPAACPDPGATPAPPTRTPTSSTPTATPTSDATSPAPTATPTSEATVVSPTATETTQATPSPTRTPTPPPPTATETATPTPTVTPTTEPTPTVTATPCTGPECPGCTDGDGDGAGIGLDCALHDCDDADPDVHPGATELCNQRDDDCDDLVDDGFDLQTDEQNCGSCGNGCALPQANETCATGTCTVGTCEAGWSNADGASDNGCECAKNEAVANDSSATAIYLGQLPESGATATSSIRIMPWSAAEGFDVDWFRADVVDDFDGDFAFVVTLSGLPANNYRLTVYRGAPPGDSATYACGFLCLSTCRYPAAVQATSNGAASVALTLDEGSVCSDDGGTFYVSVEQLSGTPACSNLTLTLRNG